MQNKKLIGVVVVILVITIGAIGWMFAKKSQVSVKKEITTKPATQLVSDNEVENWQTYRNKELGFEFKYPTGMMAINNPQQNNIVIENSDQENFIGLTIHYASSFYKTCDDFNEMFKDIKKVEKNIKTDNVDIQKNSFNFQIYKLNTPKNKYAKEKELPSTSQNTAYLAQKIDAIIF